LRNTTIGPNVSIGTDCIIENSKVKNSLIQNQTTIINANLDEAMIGNHVKYNGEFTKISIGDYTTME
jgi:glucose-1-phosphate thymidylyltransferase